MSYFLDLGEGQFAEFDDDVDEADARRQVFDERPDLFTEDEQRLFQQDDAQEGTSAFGRGIRSGTTRTIGSLGALPDLIGGDHAQGLKELEESSAAAAEANAVPTTFGDVRAGFGEGFWEGMNTLATYSGELAGGSLPFMAGTLAGGAVGSLAGPVGTFAGATAGGFPQFLAENVSRQVEEGATEEGEIDWLAAVAAGGVQSSLNAITPVVTGIFGKAAQGAFIQQALSKAAAIPGGRYAAAGIASSQIEGWTELGQQALERSQAGLSPFDSEESLEAFAGGTILGLVMGPLGAAVSRTRKAPDDTTPPPDDPLAPIVPPAPEPLLALPPPDAVPAGVPLFDFEREENETPQQYADRAIRVAGLEFPEGPYIIRPTQSGAFQVATNRGQLIGRPLATADQAQDIVNVYNERSVSEETERLARDALERTKQGETEALLQTARETVTPLGLYDIQEVGPQIAGRVNNHRVTRGLASIDQFSIEDLAEAGVPQGQITPLIEARKPRTTGRTITSVDIIALAEEKNIAPGDDNFKTFALRTTGRRDLSRMNQTQLQALHDVLADLPAHEEQVTMPVVKPPRFNDDQYQAAVDATEQAGTITFPIIRAATGLKNNTDIRDLADTMARRGAAVKHSDDDYRLSDTLGRERKQTAADLPEGAESRHSVREVPVSQVRVRQDGKSLGTFNSATEAQARIRAIRAKEEQAGNTTSDLVIEPADAVAQTVFESRYDKDGNFLGAAPVGTFDTQAEAEAEARALDGIPEADAPVRAAPEALRGRVAEVQEGLAELAKKRGFGMLGDKITLTERVDVPGGGTAEGIYQPAERLIKIAVDRLTPDMTTEQIIDQLAQVMDHELVHVLRNVGLLSPDTKAWKALSRFVRRRKRNDTGETFYENAKRVYEGQPGYERDSDIEEEAIAEAFRYWAGNRRAVVGEPASIFKQIVEWFRGLGDSMRNRLPNSLFEIMETGQGVAAGVADGNVSSAPRYSIVAKRIKLKQDLDEATAFRDIHKRRAFRAGVGLAASAKYKEWDATVRSLDRQLKDVRAEENSLRRGRASKKTVLGETPSDRYSLGPLPDVKIARDLAADYKKKAGITAAPLNTYLEVPDAYLQAVADYQEQATHAPDDAEVKKAYGTMGRELKAQYRMLGDLDVEPWYGEGEPYPNSAAMVDDLRDNKHLFFFLTDDGFGQGEGNADHPLLEQSGFVTTDGKPLLMNDVFRIAHDFFGHGQNGYRFDARGEYNAYHEHARMFSEDARPALAAETLAQNAWFNYGPHLRNGDGAIPKRGDDDFVPPQFRDFSEQKAHLIPDTLLEEDPGLFELRRSDPENVVLEDTARLAPQPRFSLGQHKNLSLEFAIEQDVLDNGVVYTYGISSPDGQIVGELIYRVHDAGPEDVLLSKDRGFPLSEGEKIGTIDWVGPIVGERTIERANARRAAFADQIDVSNVGPSEVRRLMSALVERHPSVVQIKGYRISGARKLATEIIRKKATEALYRHTTERDPGALADYEQAHQEIDDVGTQIVPTGPLKARIAARLPDGREFGDDSVGLNDNLASPDSPAVRYSLTRDGNAYFAGEVVEAQLDMARTGRDGAFLVYMSPEEFLDMAQPGKSTRQQEGVDWLLKTGERFNTLPALVIDEKGDGVATVDMHDGRHRMRALQANGVYQVPVMVFPHNKQPVGLISTLVGQGDNSANRMTMPMRQEMFDTEDAASRIQPRYSMGAALGERVPPTTKVEIDKAVFNIVHQRTEGAVGDWLMKIGRSKKRLPLVGRSIFDMRVAAQDKMLSVKEMVETIRVSGGRVSDFTDTYLQEQLYHGRVVERIRQREYDLYVPLLRKVQSHPAGITVTDLEDFLYARHAKERNQYLWDSGSELEAPSGMSNAEADKIMSRFTQDNTLAALEETAAFVDAIVADTNNVRMEAGLINEEMRNSTQYEHYVPLKGFTEEDLDPELPFEDNMRARSGRGFSVSGKEDLAATGRERKAGDIIGHVFLQNEESVIRAEKNSVANSFLGLIEQNPEAGWGQVLHKVPTKRTRGADGIIRNTVDMNYRMRPDIVIAKRGGREVLVRVNDPRVAKAVKMDFPSGNTALVNTLGKVNRYLATVNTAWNPEFLISNFLRDLQTARILIEQHEVEGLAKSILKDVPASLRGVREVLRTGEAHGKWAQHFRDLQEDGGTTEFLGIRDLQSQVERIKREMGEIGDGNIAKVKQHFRQIGKFIEDYNKVVENGVRLSAYVNAIRRGVSRPQAAFLAKNLTVNFNKGGELKSVMNSWYLFYNASLQGTMVLMNGLKSKRVQKIVAGVVVAGVLQDMANRAMTDDDDGNGINDYDEVPDYVKERNFVMMDPLGVLDAVGVDRGYIALPMPYGFNAFFNLGRNLSGVFNGGDRTPPAEAAMNIVMTFADSFNPLGGTSSFFNFVAPTILDPFVDLYSNKDFAGRQIVPERPSFGVPVPQSQLFWNGTDAPFKWITEQLNSLSGGNAIRAGAADVSPETLEYVYDYVLGAAGAFAMRSYTFGTEVTPTALKGDFEDIELGQIPFLRKVVGNLTNQENISAYYDNAEAVMTAGKEVEHFTKAGDYQTAATVRRDRSKELTLLPMFKASDKQLQRLRRQLNELRENPHIPDDLKERSEKTIKDQMDTVMTQTNRLFFSVMQ